MKGNMLTQIEQRDILLSFPFETIKPFIKMLKDAAEDEHVVSIKMTLYRVAERSEIINALIEAAENGKEVIVLVELRARFDEGNNIELSRRLEEAGCRILYGLGNYKVHSKLCLITRIKKMTKSLTLHRSARETIMKKLHEYCRTVFGAFQNIPFWCGGRAEGISCIGGLYDKKYGSASGGSGSCV